LRAGVEMTHNQAHFITFAKAGEDVRGRTADGSMPDDNGVTDGTVSFDDIKERNPVYNPTYDAVGKRFRAEETTVFTWSIRLAFPFCARSTMLQRDLPLHQQLANALQLVTGRRVTCCVQHRAIRPCPPGWVCLPVAAPHSVPRTHRSLC